MKLSQWLGFLCLVVSLFILWQIRQMLLLLFGAIVLATALNALVRRLQKGGFQRRAAVSLALISVLVLAVLFISVIVPPFISQLAKLADLIPAAFTRIVSQLEEGYDHALPWLPRLVLPTPATLTAQFQPLLQNLLRNFFAFFSDSLNALLETLVAIVLTVMLLANPQAYRRVFLRLFPSFYRRRADEILVQCEVSLGNWLAGLVISSTLVAALTALGLWILQIDLVLAHALLAGLLNFIPNIGPTLSVVFPLVVALLDAPWKAIAVVILYFVIQQLESYLLTPTVMEKQVALLPAFTLASQIFFASFFGVLGLLLALPLTVVAKTWIEEALIKDILDQWHHPPVRTGLEQHRIESADIARKTH